MSYTEDPITKAQLGTLVPGWESQDERQIILRLLEKLRWRPISEIHEDHGICVAVNMRDPNPPQITHVCDPAFSEDAIEYEWTHFQPSYLGNEEAELLLAALPVPSMPEQAADPFEMGGGA